MHKLCGTASADWPLRCNSVTNPRTPGDEPPAAEGALLVAWDTIPESICTSTKAVKSSANIRIINNSSRWTIENYSVQLFNKKTNHLTWWAWQRHVGDYAFRGFTCMSLHASRRIFEWFWTGRRNVGSWHRSTLVVEPRIAGRQRPIHRVIWHSWHTPSVSPNHSLWNEE